MMVLGLGLRGRYYVPFKLIEAAITISGQAYNGIDKETGKPKHDRMFCMDTDAIELGVFMRTTVEGWNHSAHMWLKECIHLRIRTNPYIKVFITCFVSAVWHGFYPVYFLGFTFYAVSVVNFNYTYKMFAIHGWLRKPFFYFLQTYYSLNIL
jgi:hypothetical protein